LASKNLNYSKMKANIANKVYRNRSLSTFSATTVGTYTLENNKNMNQFFTRYRMTNYEAFM